MGKALYRKYRPTSLSEVVGQEHITNTLGNAIKSGKISHAYLLTGPRGVGKTSIARILAHEINGLPYEELASHMDIIEIDAASNRRIDEIRELRDKVNILPTNAKYKVYIIDEVHMLTREAFNALLKTLEEPPAHAIFILATTESHKLPETIVSRTQHFTFKPIEEEILIQHLDSIAKKEKFKISNDAIKLIASHGDGSFRDSISLLDQARGISEDINLEEVQKLLGIAPGSAIDEILAALDKRNTKELMNLLESLRDQGIQSSVIAKQLGQRIRDLIIEDSSWQIPHNTILLSNLLEVSASSQPDRKLEVILLDYIFSFGLEDNKIVNQAQNKTKVVASKTESNISEIKTNSQKSVLVSNKESGKTNQEKTSTPETKKTNTPKIEFTIEAWPLVVAEVKKTNNTIYGILRMAEAKLDNGKLILSFSYPFHQKQINESKNRKIIEDIIYNQTGNKIDIECLINKTKKVNQPVTKLDIDTVSNIFGGGEVLESEV